MVKPPFHQTKKLVDISHVSVVNCSNSKTIEFISYVGYGKTSGTFTLSFIIPSTREDFTMGTRLKVGIQGKGSASVTDLGILAKLLEDQTGISITSVLQDNILLKMECLKNGTIDFM
jgi:hypothetical protein